VATGTIKSFNPKRHFGFIRPDSGGKDIFVHLSEIQKSGLASLRKGQKISFDIVDEQGRPSARNLQIDGQKPNADKPIISETKKKPRDIESEQIRPAARQAVTIEALQSVIAEAVKTSGPQCKAFVGVWLEKITPKLGGGANWKIKGVQYGRSSRSECDAALSDIIERLQQEYVILDEHN
jgi:cold shock protein